MRLVCLRLSRASWVSSRVRGGGLRLGMGSVESPFPRPKGYPVTKIVSRPYPVEAICRYTRMTVGKTVGISKQ
jgi:hypothetical protein